MTILLYLLVGLGIGMVGGMIGIGGGVLLIPALTLLFGVNARKAAGISLAVLAIPVTLPGAWKYYQQGSVTRADLRIIACLALAFAAGSYLGAQLLYAWDLDERVLRVTFGLLMLYVGTRLILHGCHEAVHAAAGLGAVATGWLVFVTLRALGRKHLPPALGDAIRRDAETKPRTDDYCI